MGLRLDLALVRAISKKFAGPRTKCPDKQFLRLGITACCSARDLQLDLRDLVRIGVEDQSTNIFGG